MRLPPQKLYPQGFGGAPQVSAAAGGPGAACWVGADAAA